VSIVPADLFLSATLTAEEACRYLARLGFADPAAADAGFRALAEDVPVREALGRLADVSRRNGPGRTRSRRRAGGIRPPRRSRPAKATFLESLRTDPRMLGLLVEAAGRSAFVADALHRSSRAACTGS
jgi:hypothetical protein